MDKRAASFKRIAKQHDILRTLNNRVAFYLEARDAEMVKAMEKRIAMVEDTMIELKAEVYL